MENNFSKISFGPIPEGWLIFNSFPLGIEGKNELKILYKYFQKVHSLII